MSKVIGLDCDGVLADFVGATLDLAHRFTSLRFKRDDIKTWDIFDYVKDPLNSDLKRTVQRSIEKRGFCQNLKVLPGSIKAVQALRELGEVVCITSPWVTNPTWGYERTEWLREHFGFEWRQIIHTGRKEFVHCDYLVDDRLSNLVEWNAYQGRTSRYGGHAILWDTPHNRQERDRLQVQDGISPMSSWAELEDFIKDTGGTP
jgi:5'(3')-deoxyribonucleotidase